ncbi:hypothetical protein LSH36_897g01085 [Paralvinella palmiformis]|uniref:Uncharacterized protein n=1 Tax=Paralvinella palmiformis TaxID=53620 RepID=A0AAD9IYH3_9ANNE|nr:hypothetical protein LSH36_897g01085 [Paralvinella palmiformis]
MVEAPYRTVTGDVRHVSVHRICIKKLGRLRKTSGFLQNISDPAEIYALTSRLMMQVMAMTMESPTPDLSHIEEGIIAIDESDKLTIARLKAELEEKNKIVVYSAVQISQLKQRLKIARFELEGFGNCACMVVFYTAAHCSLQSFQLVDEPIRNKEIMSLQRDTKIANGFTDSLRKDEDTVREKL